MVVSITESIIYGQLGNFCHSVFFFSVLFCVFFDEKARHFSHHATSQKREKEDIFYSCCRELCKRGR